MNNQRPEKPIKDDGSVLAVHSIFLTIQGEGPYTGHRAVFIRLAGCNLACPGCDTDYTSERAWMSPQAIIDEVLNQLADQVALGNQEFLVVITGGEPFRQNIAPLVGRLVELDFTVQIETNGTLFNPDPIFDHVTIVCSPKTGSINKDLIGHVDALKYVIQADSVSMEDGLPLRALGHSAEPILARPPKDFQGPIYLQPMDEQDPEKNNRNLEAAIRGVMLHGYVLQLQIHKIIGAE